MGDHTGIEWTDATGRQLGALKTAARRCGVTLDEYLVRRAAGEKRCVDCKDWKEANAFADDASRGDGKAARCTECAKGRYERTYVPVPVDERRAPGPQRIAARDGDEVQARRRINHDVAQGRRPHPDALYCAFCGHKGTDRRHEYHHHMGYSAAHHNDVLPLCAGCHHDAHAGASAAAEVAHA